MSKGSHKRKPDPRYCTPAELEKRWDEAFGKANSPKASVNRKKAAFLKPPFIKAIPKQKGHDNGKGKRM